MARLMIVDDDAAHRETLRMLLTGWGHAVSALDDGDTAVAAVTGASDERPLPDALLMDVRMARMDGVAALKAIKAHNPALPVIIMTAYSSVASARETLTSGADDYLVKPLDHDELRHTLSRVLEHTRLKSENERLKRALPEGFNLAELVGQSGPMQELAGLIAAVAPTEATVLVTGESGTGKELVARALHANSGRKDMPLVTVNCAALPENLLESELFGHEKGAFTGADKRREGRFVQADGGTLFLDEIGELPLAMQAKLLRVLQEGEVQRVGSDTLRTVDVRLIAATNRDLGERARQGEFREDLYYRLNVVALRVPHLRERRDDVPLLAQHFLTRLAEKHRKNVRAFTPRAMELLQRHTWPGNVRELRNVVERAVVLTLGDYVDESVLPAPLLGRGGANAGGAGAEAAQAAETGGQSLADLERAAVAEALEAAGGNKSEAARQLGVSRVTLHAKIKKYGLE